MVRASIVAAMLSLISCTGVSASIDRGAVGQDYRTTRSSSLTTYRIEPGRAKSDRKMEKLMDRALRGETDLQHALSKLLAEHESVEERLLPEIPEQKRLLNWR